MASKSATHADHARRLGLVIVPVADLTLVKQGDEWVDSADGQVVSKRRLSELEALVLPPNWKGLRASPSVDAHLQAVGTDDVGRLQYRYHDRWADVRNAVKAQRLLEFGRALPLIREAVARDLKAKLGTKPNVVATAVRLLDTKLVRPGNEQYAKQGTTGASTLQPGQVREDGKRLLYVGKSGKTIDVEIDDLKLQRRLAALKRRNRGRVFRYRRKARRAKSSLTASDINAYLRRVSKRGVSAKDFRTFAATAIALQRLCEVADRTPESKAVTAAIKQASKRLRNTPAVARSSYVHPLVVGSYLDGNLSPALLKGRQRAGLDRAETALMRLLDETR
ncbi:MAG: DNA topoisomerase IB [Pseudomonadota bacterium]